MKVFQLGVFEKSTEQTDLQHVIVHDAPLNVCQLGSSQAQHLHWSLSRRVLLLSVLSCHVWSPRFHVTSDQVKEELLFFRRRHPGADRIMDTLQLVK